MRITANSICAELDLAIGNARRQEVQRAFRLANAEGTISSLGMLELTRDPTRHTTTTLRSALLMLGCVERAVPSQGGV